MGNNLYNDIDRMCMNLKHGGEVDPGEVRTLLRRAQAVIEILDSLTFMGGDGLNISAQDADGMREYHVRISAVLIKQQVDDMLLYFSGHWDTVDE